MRLILSVLICQAAGLIGAGATRTSVTHWYPTLTRPPGTPPSWVFAPVWTILYFLMGVALWSVWRRVSVTVGPARRALTVFAVQLGLNALWSALFFGMRSPGLALVCILPLWAAIAATIVSCRKVSSLTTPLLAPYLLWVSYAAYLNAGLYLLNR